MSFKPYDCSIGDLVDRLDSGNLNSNGGYMYVETGRYKPWSESTVRAAERRGYKVEFRCAGVYFIYPKSV